MTIKARLLADLNKAIAEGNPTKKSVTKMLLSEISYAESSMHNTKEIDEEMTINIIWSYFRKLAHSRWMDANSKSSEDREVEMEIIKRYLPESLLKSEEISQVRDSYCHAL